MRPIVASVSRISRTNMARRRTKPKPKPADMWRGKERCKLYSTKDWQDKSARQLSIMPLCEYHARLGQYVPASIADHIIPHKCDPELFWQGKLQSLCNDCHASVKRRLEKAKERCLRDKHPQPCTYEHCIRQVIGHNAKGFPVHTDDEMPAEFVKLMQDNATDRGWSMT